MRVVFVGSVAFSQAMLEESLAHPRTDVVGIVTRKTAPFNADFADLMPMAKSRGIPCLSLESNDQDAMVEFIGGLQPDVVFCFGWSYLLRSKVLSLPPLGVIGYHPAPLPRGRGRHPIIWTLALGLPETASTFFFMDAGADSGDILDQRSVPVYPEDRADTLYERLTDIARLQLRSFASSLADNDFERIPQDHSKATYWRKRAVEDGRIDWRMSSEWTHNLVRALARPYVGAHFTRDGEEYKVWQTTRVDGEYSQIDVHEPGKVLAKSSESIDVRCGGGVIRLLEWEGTLSVEKGDYL